tara:strand:+ start:19644 stop:19823 length:180 start_codon:yes stop_codon:yes gene_type:complete
MGQVIDFLMANGAELLIAILAVVKIIVKLTPSIKDNKVFGYIDDLIGFFINNNGKKETK